MDACLSRREKSRDDDGQDVEDTGLTACEWTCLLLLDALLLIGGAIAASLWGPVLLFGCKGLLCATKGYGEGTYDAAISQSKANPVCMACVDTTMIAMPSKKTTACRHA
ncbi:hypothetical protein COCSUDRAFT_56506 [Coccomyxa subellipsoidea C-169]|uniref:Uncharacterized protein n=1 Tax=Coccomyxa subellipsoidea (strain C-169) TaxID=574566 RepID=I0YUK5_COCSC|nr:hypothetical protein COCSUDRAFT_56506 [Coccomyxa subellipsoidea C-169]EIE22074.1 hypothetical protein COCSUDRAFT_56506 [Coccomyxa subellipsoidea C-169]|eukprot:XP_005646618.1 hypothetical protein COCSUDRAFT_56506 [Coccomyxa subellipsoidea C-169]